jgi:hypothetical protein
MLETGIDPQAGREMENWAQSKVSHLLALGTQVHISGGGTFFFFLFLAVLGFNSGSHTCKVGTLSFEPLQQSFFFFCDGFF